MCASGSAATCRSRLETSIGPRHRRAQVVHLFTDAALPFSDWPTIFPNAATVTALIDRVVHHADIISLEGESYRRRVAESARKPSRDTLGR
jgi:hypothetical protein